MSAVADLVIVTDSDSFREKGSEVRGVEGSRGEKRGVEGRRGEHREGEQNVRKGNKTK